MKFNWGTGIVIFFILFATSMTLAVVATTRHPPQLMKKDYYALDLSYQERMDKKQNTANLATPPAARFDATGSTIQVSMPAGMTAQNGTVNCYRSSTAHDDISTPFGNVTALSIPADKFAPGRWHVELDWTATDGKKYFWETAVIVP